MKLSDEARKLKNEYAREWRKKNQVKINRYQRDWKSKNPEKVREYNIRYWENRAKARQENDSEQENN